MELLTHAALGALSATTLRPARLPLRWALLAGVLGGVFPDSDFILFLIDPLRFHLDWHRSFTHSLLMLPLWSVLIGLGLGWISRQSTPALMMMVALGMLSHILLDMMTAWDLQLFWPVSQQGYALAWLYVVDPWFSGLLLLGLGLSWHNRRWLLPAWLVLLLWVGWLGVNKYLAQQTAQAFAASLGAGAEASAWPQPFSSRHWKLLVSNEFGHWQSHQHLGQGSPFARWWPHPWMSEAARAFQPASAALWRYYPRYLPADMQPDIDLIQQSQAYRLWHSEAMQPVRALMKYPVRYQPDVGDDACIWFTDLLYLVPTQNPPLVYGACLQDEVWVPARKPLFFRADGDGW